MISRLGRRRRARRAQTQPDHPFAIETCEVLADGPFALLRVSGTGTVVPVSLVTQGDGPQAFDPLPQPDAGAQDGTWRIAFALSADVVEPGTRVWLHDGGLYLADLLIPSPAEPSEPAEPAVAPEAQDAAERRAVVEDRITAEREAAATRPAEAEDVGEDARARKLVEAWSEAATLREKLNDREEELAEALKELLDARKHVQPLRDRVEELTAEVEALRGELELAHKHGREARLRATEKAAELDAVRADSTAAEPRVDEQELTGLRAEVERLEQELSAARAVPKPETEETSPKSRRGGIGRRSDDRAAQKVRAELEAQRAELEGQLAEREQRIEQLEKEAESFAARREEAMADSLRERVQELEEDVRQRTATNDDLRALLDSERQIIATVRREVEDLKHQLAVVSAERVAEHTAPAQPAPKPPVTPTPSGVQPPPWSALDDELLARIEKAKSLTR